MRNFVITVNGTTYQVGVEEVGATTAASVAVAAPQAVAPVVAPAPQAATAPAPAPQAAAPKAAAKPVANGEKVLSPFPGLIKNLLVAEGTSVKKDQPILVLEAMKMDNDITAPCDGTISYKTTKGSNVDTGALMAVIA